MGTHPIFESDFDCLTEKLIMSFAGCWKRESVEGAEALAAAFKMPEEKLQRARQAELVTTISENGDNFTVKRTYTLGGNKKETTNSFTIGVESDFEGPQGNAIKGKMLREGAKLVGTSGSDIKMELEIIGGKLVESVQAKGVNFKRTSGKC